MHQGTPSFPLPSWAREALESVQEILREELPEALQSMLTGGDREYNVQQPFPLRPYLLLLVARHFGCFEPRALRLAASVHMIHIASLLHERLGAFSASSHEGVDIEKVYHQQESMDILLGDFFFSKASCILIEDGDQRIIEDMIKTSLASAEAQARIASLDDNPASGDPSRCFETVAEKQSLLIALALRVGAILAGASREEEEILSEYGRYLGKAFRVVQDVAFWQSLSESVLRLPREVKYSHPMLLLWEGEGGDAWQQACRRLRESERDVREEIRSRIQGKGYTGNSLGIAREFSERAVQELDRAPGLSGFDELKDIARVHLFHDLGSGEESCR